MMKFHYFQVLIACLLLSQVGLGQGKDKAAIKAREKYDQLGYNEAIELYQQGEPGLEAKQHIANSYRLKGDSWNAARWYAQVVAESTDPLDYLHYAQALQSNGDYEKAKAFFLKYNQSTGYSRSADKRGQWQAEAIGQLDSYMSTTDVQVRNERSINSEKLDFSPAFFKDGIVFVSNRSGSPEKDAWTGDGFSSLFFVQVSSYGQPGVPVSFALGADARFHDGPVTFNPNGELAFLTQNREMPGKKRSARRQWNLKIYTTARSGEGWTEPMLVDLADELSNDAHPALSPDGMKLYFSSDRPGGYGGMDIYVTAFKGGTWGHPVNLGSDINTSGNETFPFIAANGTLYFASDGWGGLGGMDIFSAEKMEGIVFDKARNLGAPFNSPKDDFGLILAPSGKEGYFTSSREGGQGKDDIYRFSSPSPLSYQEEMIQMPDFQDDKKTESLLALASSQDCPSLAGHVANGRSITGATVILVNLCTNEVSYLQPDSEGRFALSCLPEGCDYILQGFAPGFSPVNELISTVGLTEHSPKRLEYSLQLQPAPAGQGPEAAGAPRHLVSGVSGQFEKMLTEGIIIGLDKIYYDFDRDDLRPEATGELDKVVSLLQRHPELRIELRSHTDSKGPDDYNLELSTKRAAEAAFYLAGRGIDPARISSRGFGESMPINDCPDETLCSEEEHQVNRRTEIKLFLILPEDNLQGKAGKVSIH